MLALADIIEITDAIKCFYRTVARENHEPTKRIVLCFLLNKLTTLLGRRIRDSEANIHDFRQVNFTHGVLNFKGVGAAHAEKASAGN